MVIAAGSYPAGRWFESDRRYQTTFACRTQTKVRPHGLMVRTPPFHGGNRGSNPLGVTIKERTFVYQGKSSFFMFFRAKMRKNKQNKGKNGLRDGQTAVTESVFSFSERKNRQKWRVTFGRSLRKQTKTK